jgi:hypothetical protein
VIYTFRHFLAVTPLGTSIAILLSAEFFLVVELGGVLSRMSQVLGDLYMTWLIRRLRLPAGESNTSLALAVCIFLMSLMSIGIIWQAQIIADQRQAIRWLESLKFGG